MSASGTSTRPRTRPPARRPRSSRSPVRSAFPHRHRRSASSSPRSPPTTDSPVPGWRASTRTRAASCGSARGEGSTASTATRSGTSGASATTARRSPTTTSTSSPRTATASSGSAPALASVATTARTRPSAPIRSDGERQVLSMLHAKNGTLWFGGDNGLYRFDKASGKATRYTGSADRDGQDDPGHHRRPPRSPLDRHEGERRGGSRLRRAAPRAPIPARSARRTVSPTPTSARSSRTSRG